MKHTLLSRAAAFITTLALLLSYGAPLAVAANITAITVNGGTTLAATTTITTVTFTPITALTDGSTFNIYYPATVNDAGLVFGDITPAADGHTFGAATVNTGTDTISIPVTVGAAAAPVTLTFANAHFIGPASGNISFAVTTSVGDTGAQLVYVAGTNQVAVTATVEPILSMSLSDLTIALGVLSTSANTYTATGATTVTTATNAQGGVVVAMASTGLVDATIGREIGVTNINGGVDQTAGIDYYKLTTHATPAIVDVNGADLTAAVGTDMLATQNVVSNAAPHNASNVLVTIAARADTTTEAGNYSDTLTFTSTASF